MLRKIVFFLSLLWINVVMSAPIVPYKVLEKYNDSIELRQYSVVVLASVSAKKNQSDNDLFRILFRYIDGGNAQERSIPMTAPVFVSFAKDNVTMSFAMPQGSTLKNLPKPNNNAIKMHLMQHKKYMVINFSGRAIDDNFDHYQSVLLDFVHQKKMRIITTQVPMRALYNSPWTLPFFKRNEVFIPVR
jgi:hypothetical protein